MTDEIQEIVDDQEKADKLQQIIEKKVQKEVQKTVKNLKQSEESKEKTENSSEEVSRRSFLKKLGAGAIGLGAASLLPSASAYKVKSGHGFDVTSDGTEYFDVDPSGKVKVKNAALQIDTGQSIEDNNGTKAINLLGNGSVEIPIGNLRLNKGQFIEDGNGTERIAIDPSAGFGTHIYNDDGKFAFRAVGNFGQAIYARSNEPVRIQDNEGDFTAVKYDTDTSAGVLKTPNAGIVAQDNGTPSSGAGLELTYTQNNDGRVTAYDRNNNNYIPLYLRGSRIDFSDTPANLRLATGQSIEDGSGTARLDLHNYGTDINSEEGSTGIRFAEGEDTFFRVFGSKLEVDDNNGGFIALQYTTSSSAPGTLELKNANLDAGGNDITNAGSVSAEEIGAERHLAEGFDGADPDSRLDAALSNASDGDVIYLENAEYSEVRSISVRVSLIGTGGMGGAGTTISADWTLSGIGSILEAVSLSGGTITINGVASRVENIYGSTSQSVTVDADYVGIYNCYNVDVTFQSNTNGGMADGLRNSTTPTDNGSNTIGDVS
ncbi:twin-arginine translocation signal domain-containing protein [Candidatus Nanohalobium constans]|uniref:Twin-arginine translocation signal domain-containing protein n=1 Tax=Candidatus Nanohalobium constans TaxID=2565781 RepID=A0A5Q0UF91_9ARCH|nr:twin-arginine translocation signal domain-containing protein [Candidatus Nanohalobium constans]QGA80262.1 hypothetical protein LC1Nh_0361 [Candidatus Nanohalobium constans]